jgi:hypothetical protein
MTFPAHLPWIYYSNYTWRRAQEIFDFYFIISGQAPYCCFFRVCVLLYVVLLLWPNESHSSDLGSFLVCGIYYQDRVFWLVICTHRNNFFKIHSACHPYSVSLRW